MQNSQMCLEPLGALLQRLAARKINITSGGYQTIEKESKKASVVLEVSHLDKALRIYRRHRFGSGYMNEGYWSAYGSDLRYSFLCV